MLFFDKSTLLNMINCFDDESLGAVCSYVHYNSKPLDLLYMYKKLIHRLEEKIFNPATIGGELLAFRGDIIDHLDEFSLAEDLQVNILCVAKGYRVRLIQGNLIETYPETLHGIASRTERVIIGTFIEYKRWKELSILLNSTSNNKLYKYIFSYMLLAYLIGLVFIPLTFILGFIILCFLSINFILTYNAYILSFIFIAVLLITVIHNKARSLLVKICRISLGLTYGAINALNNLRFVREIQNRDLKIITALWREGKYVN